MASSGLITVVDRAVPASLFRRVQRGLERVGGRASYWKTFWFDLGEPAMVVEELARALRPRVPLADVAGVEWWIGRMDTHDVLLDFHHDRDLALFDATGRVRHPDRSSVFFVNRVKGGSLFVTDQKLARRGRDLVLSPAQPRAYDSARPAPNRFAMFPGDLFHGVLDANDEVPDEPLPGKGEVRLSVVLNWWRRRPLAVKTWRERRSYRELAGV